MVRATVPADGRMTITDYGYRDWGPELVSYTVDPGRFKPGQVVLVDGRGKPVPHQIDGNTLSFVASVPKGSSVTYILRARQPGTGGQSGLQAGVEGGTFVVRNDLLAVQMPAPGTRSYAPPVEATRVASPILRWAGHDGAWMGGARFVTPRKLAAHEFRVVRQGPAVVEYEARYRFVPQGQYVCRVQVSPGMPVAIVTEEFDFGEITGGEDLLVLDLHRGWKPAHVGWVPGSGEQSLPALQSSAYPAYVAGRRTARQAEAPVGGVGEAPQPVVPEKGMVLLEKILPAGRWGDAKGGVQLWDGDLARPGSGRNVALVPLSVGSWRRAMALCAWYEEQNGMAIALPWSMRWSRWSLPSPLSPQRPSPQRQDSRNAASSST